MNALADSFFEDNNPLNFKPVKTYDEYIEAEKFLKPLY